MMHYKIISPLLLCCILSFSLFGQANNVGIGTTTPDSSAVLDITATGQGILIPRTDTAAVNANNPAIGLLIYQESDKAFYSYNGTKWVAIGGDNLGSHLATQNIQLNNRWITNDGDNEGIWVGTNGYVAIGDSVAHLPFVVQVDSSFISESLDQSITATGNPLNIAISSSGAQSVSVGSSGNVSKSELSIRTTLDSTVFQLEIRTGNDPSSGTIIHTDTITSLSTNFSYMTVDLPQTINVEQGDMFTFVLRYISGSTGQWDGISSDIYPGGNAFVDASGWIPLITNDLALRTYIETLDSIKVSALAVGESGVSIGVENPDPSALLDIKSTTKGMLTPRMTAIEREAIISPSKGLLVFDTDSNRFWFYDGAAWAQVSKSTLLEDTDADTKIQVEEGTDDDKIRFDLGGEEHFVMDGPRLEVKNSGHSVFIGEGAGVNDDLSDNYNVAVGDSSLYSNTTGNSNIAIGNRALYRNTDRSNLVAVGDSALYNNGVGVTHPLHGTGNTAIGSKALYSNTTGVFHVATGYQALYSNTTGEVNIATGTLALFSNTIGNTNLATGYAALYSNIDGGNNAATGTLALFSNIDGNNNAAYGNRALEYNITGNNNTAYGNRTLYNNTSGDYNTAIGSSADVVSNNLSKATAIGYNAKVNCSNCLVLGGTGSDAVSVGIGTNTPTATLDVRGSAIFNEDGSNVDFRVESDVNQSMLFVDASSNEVGIGTSTPNATLDVRGSAIFNEDGSNVDFRVESDFNQYMLFVDASSNEVGIGTNVPNATLDVRGSAIFNEDGSDVDFRIESDFNPNMLFLDAAGNGKIGIAKDNPQATLDVNGDVIFREGAVFNDYNFNKDFQVKSLNNSNMLFVDASSNEVGIGTSTPNATLDVRGETFINGTGGSNGTGGGLRIGIVGNSWKINRSSDTDANLVFWYNGNVRGYLRKDVDVGSIDFTAQHRNIPSTGKTVRDFEDKIGMIVRSTGEIYNLDGSTTPTISESLPHVELSDKPYDKSIYGVVAGIEDPDATDEKSVGRTYSIGTFVTSIDRVDENDYRLIINSGGEGAVWVSNYNGSIENGDLVVTSPIAGIGMRQDDGLVQNYTVAKVVMDCDFDLAAKNYECKEVTHDGKTYRMALLACVYKCN